MIYQLLLSCLKRNDANLLLFLLSSYISFQAEMGLSHLAASVATKPAVAAEKAAPEAAKGVKKSKGKKKA